MLINSCKSSVRFLFNLFIFFIAFHTTKQKRKTNKLKLYLNDRKSNFNRFVFVLLLNLKEWISQKNLSLSFLLWDFKHNSHCCCYYRRSPPTYIVNIIKFTFNFCIYIRYFIFSLSLSLSLLLLFRLNNSLFALRSIQSKNELMQVYFEGVK